MVTNRLTAVLPLSYTFTGAARNATITLANNTDLVLVQNGSTASFVPSNVTFVRARLVASGAQGLEPAVEVDPDAWGVVGTINNWGETDDFAMTKNEDAGFAVFVSDPIEMKAGDEIKIRLGGAWDVNYGADGKDGANIVIEADGTYVVSFEPLSGAVAVVDAATEEPVFTYEGIVAWGVVGSFNDWGGSEDLPMTDEDEDNIFKSEPTEFTKDTELKCRMNADWTLNYGADGQDGANVKIEEDGTYIVILDLNEGTVTVEKQ